MTKPYYQDSHIKIYRSDCRAMSELEDNSVQCVVTSPPYWGLRKYSGNQDLIWGDNHCEHQWGNEQIVDARSHIGWNDYMTDGKSRGDPSAKRNTIASQGSVCSLCGAWKGAFGLEPTPEMYVQHTIEILREIRRVLRKDGVVFWNIGDTYSATRWSNTPSTSFNPSCADIVLQKETNLPPKNLCLIPFRIAIAAQEDGWYIRSVIIWSKPNPMPESVTDRPTESHEYILLLTKSKNYYWDADAVREEYTEPLNRWGGPTFRESSHKYIELGGHDGQQKYGATSMFREGRPVRPNEAGRNIRSVWEFPTQPFPTWKLDDGTEVDHFAVFPEKLPEQCIKAATPEVGCCSKCGKPWARITKRESYGKEGWAPAKKDHTRELQGSQSFTREEGLGACGFVDVETLGWQPTCNCNADKVPSIVLDPFMGTGTTLWVAKKLGRKAVGYDISEEYCRLSLERNRQYVMSL